MRGNRRKIGVCWHNPLQFKNSLTILDNVKTHHDEET